MDSDVGANGRYKSQGALWESKVQVGYFDNPPQVQNLIPISDSMAALEFCQRLNDFLSNSASQTISPPVNGLELSIVIPVFNEFENLPVLYDRLVQALESRTKLFEIIFVDDGSRDQSGKILQEFSELDERVTVVALARNFGHQIAITAGLSYTRGKAVIVMDADLQDPPELIPQLVEKWHEGHDVVYAVREKRKEGWVKQAAYKSFYRLLHQIACIDIPIDAGDFCIMDRKVVDLLVSMPERNRFVRGIRTWVGFDQVGLSYERQSRYAGQPKYSISKLIYLALDGLVSFSVAPLRAISLLGIMVSIFSVLFAVWYALQKVLFGFSPPGFATLAVSIFFLSGVQLVTLGVIGEYIGRIFEEVKQRPLFVVKRVIGGRIHANSDAG